MIVAMRCTGAIIAVSLKKRFDISLGTVVNAILAATLGSYCNIALLT
jgi:hypothetical protein